MKFEAFQWLYVAVVAPLFGWIGGVFGAVWKKKKKAKEIVKFLCGLPPESKEVLIEYYERGTHTLRGDPLAPAVKLLVKQGILLIGPGGGTYDAVDRYVSVSPKVWAVMDKWAREDEEVINELSARLLERETENT